MKKDNGLIIFFLVFWCICSIFLVILKISADKKLKSNEFNESVYNATRPNVFTTFTSFTDINNYNWNFEFNTSANLEFNYASATSLIKNRVWDSSYGIYKDKYLSMTSDVNILGLSLSQNVLLGSTPMYLDDFGIQRTFRLVLRSGDVRIESTNGETSTNNGTSTMVPKFWSIFNADITQVVTNVAANRPTGWPTQINMDGNPILWQTVGPGSSLAAQFLRNGDLVINSFANSQNILFRASTYITPLI